MNEVYHMYNRHQYPFVALNIAVASGKKSAGKVPLNPTADLLSHTSDSVVSFQSVWT